MATKQERYQARLAAAGKCRRCGRRDRLLRVKTGRLSPHCFDCGIKASAEAKARYDERKKLAGTTATVPAGGAPETAVCTGAPATDPESVREMALAAHRCAACKRPLPKPRLDARVEMCYSCQPPI